MKFLEKKTNLFFIINSAILLFTILFADSESLNSYFINYEDNLVINEVNVLSVDYNKVIYNNNTTNNQTPVNNDIVKPTNPTNLANNVASTDYWAWPTDANYTITTHYSPSHKALDLYSYAGYGANIYAVNNGTITSVQGGCVAGNLSCNGRGGNYIVINHNQNNYYTVYMHLKDIKVKVGDTVSRGQVIGTMGNTGNVIPVPTPSAPYLGTHLHFCLYKGQPYHGGYPINPMNLY